MDIENWILWNRFLPICGVFFSLFCLPFSAVFIWLGSLCWFDVSITLLQRAENCWGNLKDRHQTWVEEGHKNHVSRERKPRTWHHSRWSYFCGGREAPSCFQEGWEWSGDQSENVTAGGSHGENHRIDSLGWKISHTPCNGYHQTRPRGPDLRWRNARLKRAQQERKPHNQVWYHISIKTYCRTEIWPQENTRCIWQLTQSSKFGLSLVHSTPAIDLC